MMKSHQRFWMFPAWVFCLMAAHVSVHAEVRTPEEIVKAFNGDATSSYGIPHYPGHIYTTASGDGEVITRPTLRQLVFQDRDLHSVDLSAYTNLHTQYAGIENPGFITTFRAVRTGGDELTGNVSTSYAWLAYDPQTGRTFDGTEAVPTYLTLGAAWLYAQFVQGKLAKIALPGGQEYDWTPGIFRNALDLLYNSTNSTDKWTNEYMIYLDSIMPQGVGGWDWFGDYILGGEYDNIGFGDYYVFVMNVYDIPSITEQPTLGRYAGMLYAIPKNSDDPKTTPEPATLLLWALGGLGLGGTSWLRRRNKKRLVLA